MSCLYESVCGGPCPCKLMDDTISDKETYDKLKKVNVHDGHFESIEEIDKFFDNPNSILKL